MIKYVIIINGKELPQAGISREGVAYLMRVARLQGHSVTVRLARHATLPEYA